MPFVTLQHALPSLLHPMPSTTATTSPPSTVLRLHYIPVLTHPYRAGPSNGAAVSSAAGAPASELPSKRRRLDSPGPSQQTAPTSPRWAHDKVFVDCLKDQVFPHVDHAIAQLPTYRVNTNAIAKKVSPACAPLRLPTFRSSTFHVLTPTASGCRDLDWPDDWLWERI